MTKAESIRRGRGVDVYTAVICSLPALYRPGPVDYPRRVQPLSAVKNEHERLSVVCHHRALHAFPTHHGVSRFCTTYVVRLSLHAHTSPGTGRQLSHTGNSSSSLWRLCLVHTTTLSEMRLARLSHDRLSDYVDVGARQIIRRVPNQQRLDVRLRRACPGSSS